MPADQADLAYFLAATGCRIGEVLAARWRDVGPNTDGRPSLTIPRAKTPSGERTAPTYARDGPPIDESAQQLAVCRRGRPDLPVGGGHPDGPVQLPSSSVPACGCARWRSVGDAAHAQARGRDAYGRAGLLTCTDRRALGPRRWRRPRAPHLHPRRPAWLRRLHRCRAGCSGEMKFASHGPTDAPPSLVQRPSPQRNVETSTRRQAESQVGVEFVGPARRP